MGTISHLPSILIETNEDPPPVLLAGPPSVIGHDDCGEVFGDY